MHRIGLARPGLRGAVLLSAILIGICFLPLVLLTALDDTLAGTARGMPLLGDLATLGRLLVALPALILMAPDSDALSRRALRHFLVSGIVRPADRPAFLGHLQDVMRLRDSIWPELAIALLAFLPALVFRDERSVLAPIAGWSLTADHVPTSAGVWLSFVAKPILLLVVLLWVWRLVLWTILLWRICRLNLNLHAAHPDGAGGLGFLPEMQQRFSKFAFAGGVVIAGATANEILYQGATLQGVSWILIAYVVFAMILMYLPLLVISPTLTKLKRKGLLAYGNLGNIYLQAFEAKWLNDRGGGDAAVDRQRGEALEELGGEYGTLTDLNAAFGIVRGLAVVPMSKDVLLGIALPAILPMIPVVFLALGAQEILKRLLSLLG